MDSKLDTYQGLVDLILTTEDVVKLGEEIDILLKGLYHIENGEFQKKLEEDVRVRVASEIRRLLGGVDAQNRDEIKAIFSSINTAFSSLPTLKLVLAFEPTEQIIVDVSRWARTNLEKGILLDLSMDRNIMGGALIIHKGKFYDFSVRRKLREIFEKGVITL